MGLAIGKKGASIKKASEVMGKKIEVVEYNNNPEQFIKNCFLPAQVITLTFEGEPGAQSVTVDVRDEDRGIAIGKDGKNIFKAKKLAQRQHDIADVQILQKQTGKAILSLASNFFPEFYAIFKPFLEIYRFESGSLKRLFGSTRQVIRIFSNVLSDFPEVFLKSGPGGI